MAFYNQIFYFQFICFNNKNKIYAKMKILIIIVLFCYLLFYSVNLQFIFYYKCKMLL